jgi:hypothetical protein
VSILTGLVAFRGGGSDFGLALPLACVRLLVVFCVSAVRRPGGAERAVAAGRGGARPAGGRSAMVIGNLSARMKASGLKDGAGIGALLR